MNSTSRLTSSETEKMEGEMHVVEINPELAQESEWHSTIVGYFQGEKLPYMLIKNEASKQWGKEGSTEVSSTENGFYLFKFSNEQDCIKILEMGPCHMLGRVLVLKKWHRMCSLKRVSMKNVPVWVKLFNLPYEYWNEGALSRVASAIGVPMYSDLATTQMQRICYARLCVELDAEKEVVRQIKLKMVLVM